MRKKELALPVSAFVLFIAIRVAVLVSGTMLYPHYGDGFVHYIPAGIAYLSGASVDSVNPEHPPLAKYIIGFFQLHLGGAQIGSILFGVGMCFIAFLLARELVGSDKWASITILLLSFDMIMVSISVYPLLDVFALFFAVLGIYLILKATKVHHFLVAGVVFGLAIACKWFAVFWLAAALLFMAWERHVQGAVVAGVSSIAAYIIPYLSFVAQNGIMRFLNLQVWMLHFMERGHEGSGLAAGLAGIVLFCGIGFILVAGFDPAYHFEGLRLLVGNFIFYGSKVTLPIFLLFFPITYVELKSHMNRTRVVLLLALASATVMQIAGRLLEWHLASMILILSIFSADLFKNHVPKRVTHIFLGLIASWPLWADVITHYFVFHMFQG
jgi:hypothetical protein